MRTTLALAFGLTAALPFLLTESLQAGGHHTANAAMQADPCCGPPGYAFAPGCCECPPSCCDNAWDGYCEEKARCQAFWQNFWACGCRRGCCVESPTGTACTTCGTAERVVGPLTPRPMTTTSAPSPTIPAAPAAKPAPPTPQSAPAAAAAPRSVPAATPSAPLQGGARTNNSSAAAANAPFAPTAVPTALVEPVRPSPATPAQSWVAMQSQVQRLPPITR